MRYVCIMIEENIPKKVNNLIQMVLYQANKIHAFNTLAYSANEMLALAECLNKLGINCSVVKYMSGENYFEFNTTESEDNILAKFNILVDWFIETYGNRIFNTNLGFMKETFGDPVNIKKCFFKYIDGNNPYGIFILNRDPTIKMVLEWWLGKGRKAKISTGQSIYTNVIIDGL